MRLLILGLSSLAVRRLLPALDAVSDISVVDIGTTKAGDKSQDLVSRKLGVVYKGYDEALRSSAAEIVYVSLVNSLHELWVERALQAGKHVIVDKPAFLSHAAAEKLSGLAAKSGLCLAEALVYPYHPQHNAIRQLFREHNDAPIRVSAMLTIPPLDPGNFRYQAGLGGGALWDLGPYAGSVGRVFFDSTPQEAICRVNSRIRDLEVSFSALLTYSDGRSVVGHFGFDTQYENRITITGEKISMTIERYFTTPPIYQGELKIVHAGGAETIVGPGGDSFEQFFGAVVDAIARRDTRSFAEALLQDAAVLDTMRLSAGVKHAN